MRQITAGFDYHADEYGLQSPNKIDDFRIEMKMRKIRRGDRSCLTCEKKFFSEDLSYERLCESCNKIIKKLRD